MNLTKIRAEINEMRGKTLEHAERYLSINETEQYKWEMGYATALNDVMSMLKE